MRFRPRKILPYLLIGIGFTLVLANFIGYSSKGLEPEKRGMIEGIYAQRNPKLVLFEDRFKKYELRTGNASLQAFQTIRFLPKSTREIVAKGGTATVSSSTVSKSPIAANGSENELFRHQFLKRIPLQGKRSPWLVSTIHAGIPVDDRIVEQMSHSPRKKDKRVRRLKTIYVPSGVDTPLGGETFAAEKCRVRECNITTDAIHESTADLRLLQTDAYFSKADHKPPGQIWAIWILESPANTVDFSGSTNLINWTATYRWDSTIVTPYAKFVPFPNIGRSSARDVFSRSSARDVTNRQRTPTLKRNYAANKTKMVAWFVSNCNAKNRRWEFVQELNKYIPIDIFGACGNRDCPRSAQHECDQRLNSDYKFYLSFENSNCDYYITEKFFEVGLGNDVVPIVMGARREDYKMAAPPHSYIQVDDFQTVKDLANYMLKLNSSDRLYNEYFAWKGTGQFINTKFWCRLCALLHDESRPNMWYSDFQKWWTHPGACKEEGWGV